MSIIIKILDLQITKAISTLNNDILCCEMRNNLI